LKDKINKKIINLGIEKNAILLGYVDNAKQYLKAFDCLIIPSIKEGLPYAILEAGYAGIDVLSSDTGGTSEIVDNNINGILIKNTDIRSIEEGIENIVRNKDKEFGKKLKNKIEDKFSLRTMQEETKKLYKEILNP
jgi:glycosyltransferase involved in cell wall biosynthesis